jgi:RNA polymerase sigma-70 factor (ECF subfamily)
VLKLKAIKAGESDDFPAFYSRYERLIRGTLFHLIGRNDLDDLVQQTFIRCWEKRAQFEGRSKQNTWITRIAINLAQDHWRKNKLGLTTEISPEQENEIPDEQGILDSLRRDNRQVIEHALSQLSFEHRSVIALMYFQDMSLDEIGEATGEPLGTIKSRLHYAKAELRRLLINMGIEL